MQWKVEGSVTRRDQSHALGFFLGAHTSTRPEAARRALRATALRNFHCTPTVGVVAVITEVRVIRRVSPGR